MKRIVRALLFILTASINHCALAQNEVELGVPLVFTSLRYDLASGSYEPEAGQALRKDYWAFSNKKSLRGRIGWTVFTNRPDVRLLDGPNGVERGRLPFSQLLFVYAEEGEFVKVGVKRGRADGWVHKRDLILWNNPLRDRDTGIEIKAFAVNTTRAAGSISSGAVKKDRYLAFDAPQGGGPYGEERPLYDVLFVFQYEPGIGDAPGRYLVADHSDLNSGSLLAGWVNEDRLRIWQSHLCLEPNWEPEAIKERRDRKIYAHLFEGGERQEAQQRRDAYFKGAGVATGRLFETPRDPAFEEDGANWKDRLNGDLFRYPVFRGAMKGQDDCVFLTGAPTKLSISNATITEGAASSDIYRQIREELESMDRKRQNLNVLFVVEAGAGNSINVRSYAIKAVEELRRMNNGSLSMGAVLYGNDDAVNTSAKFLYDMKLVPNGEGLDDWFRKQDWNAKGDFVTSRPAHKALAKAFNMARPGETNVVVHLSGAPDHSEDEENDTRPGYMELKELKDQVKSGTSVVQYLGYIVPNASSPDLAQRAYGHLQQTLTYMAIGRREKYDSQHELHRIDGRMPEYAKPVELEAGRAFKVEPASMELRARIYDGQRDFGALLKEDLNKCLEAMEDHFQLTKKIVEDGSDLRAQADVASPEASQSLISALCESRFKNSTKRKQECIQFSYANKVHYFIDATTVYKPQGAKYPIYKYVAFMKLGALGQRIEEVNALVSDLEGLGPEKQWEPLRKHWEKACKAVLGKVDPKAELADIRERMMGLSKLNVVIPFKVDEVFGSMKVEDLNPRSLSRETTNQMIAHYVKQLNGLRSIQANKDLQYSVGQGQTYIWVPVEYLVN